MLALRFQSVVNAATSDDGENKQEGEENQQRGERAEEINKEERGRFEMQRGVKERLDTDFDSLCKLGDKVDTFRKNFRSSISWPEWRAMLAEVVEVLDACDWKRCALEDLHEAFNALVDHWDSWRSWDSLLKDAVRVAEFWTMGPALTVLVPVQMGTFHA